MKKEFVPYELAVKLKKLGFDEPCLFAFDNCSTPMRCSDLRTNEQKFNGVNYNSSRYTSQPTFSQAFRWFREKYNILATIYSNASGYLYEWHDAVGGTHRGWSEYQGPNDGGVWDTYEETEIACLNKLIEIVKGGQDNE